MQLLRFNMQKSTSENFKIEKFDLIDSEIIYVPNFISQQLALQYFNILKHDTTWQQDDIKIFGKTYAQPRLTALFGSEDKTYSYSGITMVPKTFTSTLKEILIEIENFSEDNFNTVLLNLYRNGQDSNGWHSDDEKELGKNPSIASITLGGERWFHLRNKKDKTLKTKVLLENGSLLLMKGETQHFWHHQIPKTKKHVEERINLTFRKLI